MIFIGKILHTLDNKNRMRIPAVFRSQYDKEKMKFIMLFNPNGSIGIYTEDAFEKLIAKYENVSAFDDEIQEDYTRFFSNVYYVEEDNQKRIILSEEAREHTGIKKDLITVGKSNHFEIWAAEKHREVLARKSLKSTYSDINEQEKQ